jgi:vacuolar protein sorting-associated protein 54
MSLLILAHCIYLFLTKDSRLLREAKLFDAKLGPLDGAGNVGTYLIQLVEGKTVALPKPLSEIKKSEDGLEAAASPSASASVFAAEKSNTDTS